ncbi:AfsR/SARP family transcriptional regulator [Deinococcus aquiradiocola]|uniref:Bacterial transcriptional activator domain-containing protein n=1 Tax=Deinococcus aquiradiocola TaxID=393059 RepID=A0A917PB28_9DEIO|nr:bacterial transcriptional activator domain-containing protein [Deinococcus aquiradiocola]GGJ69364.1 hypothetical protein GCM10008939_12170 [Deinococcus aquiradiocola]
MNAPRTAHPRTVAAHPAPDGAPGALHVVTLGRAEVSVDGHAVQWQAASARDLFHYLLSFPEGRTRAEIMEDLWSLDVTQESRNRFRVTTHRLRAALARPDALGEEYGRFRLSGDVLRAADVYRLHEAAHTAATATTPAARLHAYRAVLDLYRGDYLPDVHTDWARQARDEHRAVYVRAALEVSLLSCDLGNCHDAVDALQRALRADPFVGENHHQKAMTCLTVTEGRYAATEHYRTFLRFLRDDLGDTPMPETVRLAERVKNGERLCARHPTPTPPTCPHARDGMCHLHGSQELLQLN